MTFYQELQLNQAGSKALIRNIKDPKEKWKHICIYLFKILLTVAFCVVFVTIYTKVFGEENSIVGVVVLLAVMVFRNADPASRTLTEFYYLLSFTESLHLDQESRTWSDHSRHF